jgi:hypothetical protein
MWATYPNDFYGFNQSVVVALIRGGTPCIVLLPYNFTLTSETEIQNKLRGLANYTYRENAACRRS